MKGIDNMKKLTNLILMSSVVLWNKKQNENVEKEYNESIKNYKKVLKNMNKLENSEYNYNRYRYMKQKIRRLKKLKKLYENRNKNENISYNIVSSKDPMFKRVVKINQTKNLIKLKKSIDLSKVRCYNKDIERR